MGKGIGRLSLAMVIFYVLVGFELYRWCAGYHLRFVHYTVYKYYFKRNNYKQKQTLNFMQCFWVKSTSYVDAINKKDGLRGG